MTTTPSPKELGKVAAKQLHNRMAATNLLDALLSRILKTMPAPVQQAHTDDSRLLPMLSNTAGQYALCFGCACLAHDASKRFTKRVFGLIPVSDKESWHQFTQGVIEYATETMKHPATRADIVRDINDQANAVARFCENYPPEAAIVLTEAANQIRLMVGYVLKDLEA